MAEEFDREVDLIKNGEALCRSSVAKGFGFISRQSGNDVFVHFSAIQAGGFDSDNFKDRFGENSVIPIWFADCPVGMFDETRKVGGQTFDPSKDRAEQVSDLVNILAKQLEEVRRTESAADDQANSQSTLKSSIEGVT